MNFDLKQLSQTLKERKLTVATAESLTAGRVASTLTEQPGSSEFFQGGIVAYSNQLKLELLGVPWEVLAEHGAVSEQCAQTMAQGARRKLGTKIAVATTGIAGPDGGTPQKPVGLVWLAVADGHQVTTACHHFQGDRLAISEAATEKALELLSAQLEK